MRCVALRCGGAVLRVGWMELCVALRFGFALLMGWFDGVVRWTGFGFGLRWLFSFYGLGIRSCFFFCAFRFCSFFSFRLRSLIICSSTTLLFCYLYQNGLAVFLFSMYLFEFAHDRSPWNIRTSNGRRLGR